MALLRRVERTGSLPKFWMWVDRYPKRITEICGALIAISLILYFLVAYMLGFAHTVAFRLLNFPILLIGIYYGIKQFKKLHTIRYHQGFLIGLGSSLIGMSIYALFLFVMFQLDPALYVITIKSRPPALYLSTYMAAFVTWMEGIFSGFMATFLLMIFFVDTIDR